MKKRKWSWQDKLRKKHLNTKFAIELEKSKERLKKEYSMLDKMKANEENSYKRKDEWYMGYDYNNNLVTYRGLPYGNCTITYATNSITIDTETTYND